MNQLTCVDKEIAQLVGSVVQDNRTTVAFQNGSSVMEKMIVVITVMNCQKIVQFVKLILTSSVKIIVAFQNNGLVTLQTIAVMDQMNRKRNVKENIVNVLNLSSDVRMANAFQADGDVVSLNLNLSEFSFFLNEFILL